MAGYSEEWIVKSGAWAGIGVLVAIIGVVTIAAAVIYLLLR